MIGFCGFEVGSGQNINGIDTDNEFVFDKKRKLASCYQSNRAKSAGSVLYR